MLDFRSFGGFQRCYPELYEELAVKELHAFYKDAGYSWVCPNCGKIYIATIRGRVMGENCPFCKGGHKEPERKVISAWPTDL